MMAYVRVGMHWNYICELVPLFNREIIGYSVGSKKTVNLVKQAFMSVRGNEFKNKVIEVTLDAFEIQRSFSHKGCPYDNSVAEAPSKSLSTK